MNEQAPRSPENFDSLADAETGAESTIIRPELDRSETERTIEHAKAVIASEAADGVAAVLPPIIDDRPLLIDHQAKLIRMRRTLTHVQTKLHPMQRSFSRLVHHPLIQKTSEASSQTLARPSGLLGGGITAFVGSLAYQIMVRYYGLPYNFSLFIVFFVAGFLLGLLGEQLLRLSRR